MARACVVRPIRRRLAWLLIGDFDPHQALACSWIGLLALDVGVCLLLSECGQASDGECNEEKASQEAAHGACLRSWPDATLQPPLGLVA
jgi:hypothetical protein